MHLNREIRLLLQLAVIGLLVIIAAAAWTAHNKRDLMLSAVKAGLEGVYDGVVADTSHSNSPQGVTFTYESTRDAFLRRQDSTMPSFIKAEDISILHQPTSVASKKLIAVVKMPSGTLYGIDSTRTVRIVSVSEFSAWEHQNIDRPTTQALPR